MKTLSQQPAFPRPVGHAEMRYRSAQPCYNEDQEGMTFRQHLAGLAMQGLLSDHKDHSDECADGETCAQTTARLAVEHADALIARLERAP